MYFLYLWTDKSRKWSLRLQIGGKQEKVRPNPPTSHNDKPIPSRQKLRQWCRHLPGDGAATRLEERNEIHKPKCPILHSILQRNESNKYMLHTSITYPLLNQSTGSVVYRGWAGWGFVGVCPLHTFINRNYVTEFIKHELQATPLAHWLYRSWQNQQINS